MPASSSLPPGRIIRLSYAGAAAARPALSAKPCVSLTRPDFESMGFGRLQLWLLRLLWRRHLRRVLALERDEVLADLGTSREELAAYLARPFWRP